jgi:uncharacterized protein
MGLGYQDIKPVLDPVVQELAKLYGERLSKIALYGSYARGEASEESDVDLIILIRGPVDTLKELRSITQITHPALHAGLDIRNLPVSENKYPYLKTAFIQNIEREMQVLWP